MRRFIPIAKARGFHAAFLVSVNITAKELEITAPGNVNVRTQVSDKITIQGDKSVYVTQENGDIKIGKITSKGDVTLNALKGAIVNSVDTAVNMTGAADKIDAWTAAGLINDKDSDDSATNAAQEEKSIRLTGLENFFKSWALKDDGTIDQTLYDQYANNTAKPADITRYNYMSLYQELKNSNDYGFSKNPLLYAVQESLLKPTAGTTANINDPIITGRNIALYADSIGKELDAMTYSDLSNINTLKKLAGAKGGDVTFNQNGSITLKEQSPITVKQLSAENKLDIRTEGNTFVSGTADTKFNVNSPVTAGDGKVVFMTGNGIYSKKGITAKEIELYAGAGDLTANLEAGTSKVMATVKEPIITTTITYETYTIPLRILFDKYKDIPGFSVKGEEIGFLNYRCTLTAEYDPSDSNVSKMIDEAMELLKDPYITTYSRNDEYGTRDVEKLVEVKNDSVGTLTANALGNININADANLTIKNVTSGGDTTIKAEGNIEPLDVGSFVRAEDVDITATDHIGTESERLVIYANGMKLDAKCVYVLDDDVAGGGDEGGKGGGGVTHSHSSSRSRNDLTIPLPATTPQILLNESISNYAPANTASASTAINSAPNVSTGNSATTISLPDRTVSQLDRFSYSLTNNKLLNTKSVVDVPAPVNIISADSFNTKMTLIRLPDNSLYLTNSQR